MIKNNFAYFMKKYKIQDKMQEKQRHSKSIN